jgi:predicted MFS family arabinose efflux permease
MAVLMALLVVANVALLLTGQTDWHDVWLTVLLGTVLVVMYAAMPRLQRRQLRKLRRSVELNEALLKSPPPTSSL